MVRTFAISSRRLERWYLDLDRLDALRVAMKDASMSQREKAANIKEMEYIINCIKSEMEERADEG